MKKLLSLTTMAMIALATPTLSAATTANTTKEVQQVDYSKMNYNQLREIVNKVDYPDWDNYVSKVQGIIFNQKRYSQELYEAIIKIRQEYLKKRGALITEIDKRKEKYDKNHENNKEVYELYSKLSFDVHQNANRLETLQKQYKEDLDKENLMNNY